MATAKKKRKSRRTNCRIAEQEWRSGLEEAFAADLTKRKVEFTYEDVVIKYFKPITWHRYTPDFLILRNGIIIETKGRFTSHDRKKHLLVKEQHPQLDIRLVFSNPKAKLSKKSKTTYAMWCEKHGFEYADKTIPKAWLDERSKK